MHQRQLLAWPPIPILDCPRFLAEDYTILRKVEIDSAIERLDSILDEEGNLDVLVLEEFAHLLLHDLVVVGTELLRQRFELRSAIVDQGLRGTPLDKFGHLGQMGHRHVIDLVGGGGR